MPRGPSTPSTLPSFASIPMGKSVLPIPARNYVAYLASFGSQRGILGSDRTVLALPGQAIDGVILSELGNSYPFVNDSHSVLFDAFVTGPLFPGQYQDFLNYDAGTQTWQITSPLSNFTLSPQLPFGLENSGAFLGSWQPPYSSNAYYVGDASGPLYPVVTVFTGFTLSAASPTNRSTTAAQACTAFSAWVFSALRAPSWPRRAL